MMWSMLQLAEDQQLALKWAVKAAESQIDFKYILATQEDINRGYIMRNGMRFEISPSAKYILVQNASALTKNHDLSGIYSPRIAE